MGKHWGKKLTHNLLVLAYTEFIVVIYLVQKENNDGNMYWKHLQILNTDIEYVKKVNHSAMLNGHLYHAYFVIVM
jgi:hypothetical protein